MNYESGEYLEIQIFGDRINLKNIDEELASHILNLENYAVESENNSYKIKNILSDKFSHCFSNSENTSSSKLSSAKKKSGGENKENLITPKKSKKISTK